MIGTTSGSYKEGRARFEERHPQTADLPPKCGRSPPETSDLDRRLQRGRVPPLNKPGSDLVPDWEPQQRPASPRERREPGPATATRPPASPDILFVHGLREVRLWLEELLPGLLARKDLVITAGESLDEEVPRLRSILPNI